MGRAGSSPVPGTSEADLATRAGSALLFSGLSPAPSRSPSVPVRLPIRGHSAVVAGATGGLGRAVAAELARRGSHLALVDRDAGSLAQLRDGLAATHPDQRFSVHAADVRDLARVAALPEELQREHAQPSLLVNLVGVSAAGDFEEIDPAVFDWVLDVNFGGAVRLARAFLPLLREAPVAQLVNVASVHALIAPAGLSPYVASKFALRGFTMALAHELERSSVGVSIVLPGGVATGMSDRVRWPDTRPAEEVTRLRAEARARLTLDPSQAAKRIVDGVERRRKRIIVGSDARAASLLQRVLPGSYWRVVRRRFGR